MRVLLVEDNAADARFLCDMLKAVPGEAFEVHQVTQPGEALRALGEGDFDVLLLGLTGPDSPALETLSKAQAQAHGIPPVIALTASGGEAERRAAMRRGAQDLLFKKGLTAEWLARALNYAFECHRLRHALLESEARLRRLAEANLLQSSALAAAANGVLITDRQGAVLWANPAFTALTGYAPEEVVGKNPRFLKSGKQDRAFYENLWSTILSGQTWRGEFINRRKDGTLYHDEHTITPVRSAKGEITHFITIMQDITHRREAEEKTRQWNEELEQRVRERTSQLEDANQELEAFSFSVSHDLRAPLRHIEAFVGLLGQSLGQGLSEETRHCLSVITDSTKQMARLIDDLLDFSRVGRTELRYDRLDLDHLLAQTIQELQAETRGRSILWKKSPLPQVQADRALLRQVFRNLLSNAVKYTRRRDPAEIEIGCAPPGGAETIFFVRDNGVGFDMQYAGKLFGVFQRLHAEDQFEGTGIGLANVRRIVSRHGGRTWAEAKVNGGATFYFSLPLDPHPIPP